MNLFIDTNILLSFYHFTNDDLEELRKLAAFVGAGDVRLVLPEQVVDEFRRNRANKIVAALDRLCNQRLSLEFPQLCKEYEEYAKLRAAQGTYEKLHGELISRLKSDIAGEKLEADAVTRELFEIEEAIPTTTDLLDRARLRMELGKPPGKRGSLGDAVIWEILLETVPDGDALHFVTNDSDYFSPLDHDSFDPYLLREWSVKKGSELHAHKMLSSFFRAELPDIELASEIEERDRLIRELAGSPSFADTHDTTRKLSKFPAFTPAQANAIVTAAVTNAQVYWIADDKDVNRFLSGVISQREAQIDPENLRRLRYVLEEMEAYGEIPF